MAAKKKAVRGKADNSSQRAETQRQNRMRKPSSTISANNLPNYASVAGRAAKAKRLDYDPELMFKGAEKAEWGRLTRNAPMSPYASAGEGVTTYMGYPKAAVPLRPKRTRPESKSYTKGGKKK